MNKLQLHLSASEVAVELLDIDPASKAFDEKCHAAFEAKKHDAKDWKFWRNAVSTLRMQYTSLRSQRADSVPAPAPQPRPVASPLVPRPVAAPAKPDAPAPTKAP